MNLFDKIKSLLSSTTSTNTNSNTNTAAGRAKSDQTYTRTTQTRTTQRPTNYSASRAKFVTTKPAVTNKTTYNNTSTSTAPKRQRRATTPVVDTNVNTYNLSGVQQQNNHAEQKEQGKTFAQEATNTNPFEAEANLDRYNDVLSQLGDESSAKAQNLLNNINTAYQAIKQEGIKNQEYADNLRKERYYSIREERYQKKGEERDERAKSFSQEDYNNSFDENGNLKDFKKIVKDYDDQIQKIKTKQLNGMELTGDELQTLQQLETERDYYDTLDKKVTAISEKNMLDEFLANGDMESYRKYRDIFSYGENNLLERSVPMTKAVLTDTLNEIPKAIDQFLYTSKYNSVPERIDELNAKLESNEIDQDTYIRAMEYIDAYTDKVLEEYNAGLSNSIQEAVDLYHNQAYYNANDIETFLLQAGESTEQFLIHYLIGKGIAKAFAPEQMITNAGQSMAESILKDELGKGAEITADMINNSFTSAQIEQMGLNALGGKSSLVTMGMAVQNSRFDELVAEGVTPDLAYKNAVLHNLASQLVESVGVERALKFLNKPLGAKTFAQWFISGLSEGGEEDVESLIDSAIDAYTLGEPIKIDRETLKNEFALGAVTGWGMAGWGIGTNYINTNSSINRINNALNATKTIREHTLSLADAAQTQFVIDSKKSYNETKVQLEELANEIPKMDEADFAGYQTIKENAEAAMRVYEQKSQTMGVELESDQAEPSNDQAMVESMVEALEPDFNKEVQNTKKLRDIQASINESVNQMIQNDLDYTVATQIALEEGGYNIDADLFNSLDSSKKREALVAEDLRKLTGVNIKLTDEAGLRQVISENDPNLTDVQLDERVAGTDGIIVNKNGIYIDVNKADSILSTLSHELTHGTESSKYYKQLRDFVEKKLGADWQTQVNEKAGIYDDVTSFENEDERLANAEREVVAQFVQDRLNDESFLDDLVRYNYSAASRIYQNLKTLGDRSEVAQLKNKFERAFVSAESLKTTGKEALEFSYKQNKTIVDAQRELLDNNIGKLTKQYNMDEASVREMFDKAFSQMDTMADLMQENSDLLPNEVIGKTLLKDSSYGYSVENSTKCPRTLAYDELTNYVTEKVGRPLTAIESFLVSQKLYSIAVEPQCLYCYVALDRKSYNEYVGRYIDQRDAAIDRYAKAGSPELPSSFEKAQNDKLFNEFLDGRKATKNMWERYSSWINAYNNGEKLLTKYDVRNDWSRGDIENSKGPEWNQLKDMLAYAQNASWAKKAYEYRAYFDDIRKMSEKVVNDLNKHYGLRWYSFNDYTPAYILENMQQFTDAALRGLKGLAYTKDTDFAKIFAPTGVNINISAFVTKDANGNYCIDPVQSANIEEAIELRKQYKNVGIVVTATESDAVRWALNQDWTDVVIPFHIVRTGQDIADYYKWTIYNSQQNDVTINEDAWKAYVESLTGVSPENESEFKKRSRKISKMIYPYEHQNDEETFLRLCEERGLKPRFSEFLDNPNYMKLVNETRQSDAETSYLAPVFDMDAAEDSFAWFKEKGGFYGGWWKDNTQLDVEANEVANDILAIEQGSKQYEDIEYGEGYVDFDKYRDMIKNRKKVEKVHGKGNIQFSYMSVVGENRLKEQAKKNPEKYGELYKNLIDRKQLAKAMVRMNKGNNKVFTDEDIRLATGYVVDSRDGLKGIFYDDGSIDKLLKWVRNNEGKKDEISLEDDSTNTKIKDIVGEDSLFTIMYPEIAELYIATTDVPDEKGSSAETDIPKGSIVDGYMTQDPLRIIIRRYGYDKKKPKLSDGKYPTKKYSDNAIKNSLAHEIQHVIQKYEHFYYGNLNDSPNTRPGEKEAELAGFEQTRPYLRIVDENGKMTLDGYLPKTGILSQTNTGTEKENGSEDDNGIYSQTGELENRERLYRKGDFSADGREDYAEEPIKKNERNSSFLNTESKKAKTGNKTVDEMIDEVIESMTIDEFMSWAKEYSDRSYDPFAIEEEGVPDGYADGMWVEDPQDGEYIKIGDGYISDGKTVAWKDERIKELVDSIETNNFSFFDDRHQNVYAINLSPHEFRALSMIFEKANDIQWHNELDHNSEYYNNGVIDPERLGGQAWRQMGYIWMRADKDGNYSYKITGSEGNHRSIMLDESGYSKMPILLFTNKPIEGPLKLKGMNGGRGVDVNNPNSKVFDSSEYVEVNNKNLNKLYEQFGSGAKADIQYEYKNNSSDLDLTEDELNKYTKQTVPSNKKLKENIEKPLARVLTETPEKEKKSDLKKWARDLVRFKFVDRYTGVVDLAESKGNERLKDLTDWAITSNARAHNTIYKGRYDQDGKKNIGKSLAEIMGTLPKGDRQLFFEYMYNWRNVDDMSLNERFGEDNKPVFGDDYSADDSKQRIQEIEEAHPEFRKRAEEIWKYVQEDLKMQIGGLVSQDGYNNLLKMRPHYVPIARNVQNEKGSSPTNSNSLLKKMKGSDLDILPLDETLKRYTQRAYKTFDRNNLFSEIAKTLGVTDNLPADSVDDVMENDIETAINEDGNYTLTFYRNGQKMSVPVNEIIYDAFKPGKQMNEDLKKVADKWAKVNQVRKDLLTSLNPFFGVRNASKDLQDAGWNTRYAKKFPAKYLEAIAQIAQRGEFYQQFVNLGGGMSNYSAKDLGDAYDELQSNKGAKKFVKRLFEINDDIETAPRLAEFMCSLEAGNSVEKAMRDAAEVTTNFKRGGTVSKVADKYGFTFLNASIQGFDKHVSDWKSNTKEAKKAGLKGVISLMAKLTLASGLPLRLLQNYLWRDDDDYEELSDYIKDKYYIIGKTKDGKFIRINKGRIATFYQTVLKNAAETVQGKANLWDAMVDDAVSFAENIAPNNPLENNILAPITQTLSNKTWYGDDIVSSRLQDYNEWDQYDESTDELSKAIGRLSKKIVDATGSKAFGLSPKKVNYLLDQYSGVIGDVVLPALTLETETSVDNPLLKGPATAIINSFTSDPVLKNQNVADFYSLNEALQKDTKSKDATDEQILSAKYMASVSSEMGRLYAQMHDIQGSDLSNKEKMEQTRELKKQINDLARTALANYDQMDITGRYATVGGVQYYQKDDGSWVKPSSSSIEKLNEANLSDEDRDYYYSTWGDISDIRKQIKDNTPAGQTADYTQATIDAISNSKLSYQGKNTLLDSYYSGKFTDHVNSMELSDEEKYNLKVANKLAQGEKDANGKTIANSKARAVADAYRELGLLDEVLDYIKKYDVAPSEMGLSKTVYKELMNGGDTSYVGAYSKTSKSKSSSGKKSSGSKKKSSKKRSGGSITNKSSKTTGRMLKISNPGVVQINRPQEKNKQYLSAYANVMKRGSKNVSSGEGTSTCPRCHNRVVPVNGKCPICGANM